MRNYIYDLSGRLVTPLFETTAAGIGLHRQDVDVSKLNEGVYFCTLQSENYQLTKRFVVQH